MGKAIEWNAESIEILKKCYSEKIPLCEIAEILNRSVGSIRNKAWRLRIGNANYWTDEEVAYLKENYKSYNLQEIALHIGREKGCVCKKAKDLGIERNHRKLENPVGKIPWRIRYAHLKKSPEELFKIRSERTKKVWAEHEHPRGMLGKKHSDEFKDEMSERVLRYWENITEEQLDKRRLKQRATKIVNGTLAPPVYKNNPYSRTKGGKREDLNNTFFRSAWEANIARYFNFVGIKWQFEPKTFIFDTIRKGSVSYTPDFYLPEEDRWVEVKGWMDQKSITKLKRFKKYYPEEYSKLEIIGAEEYKAYQKYARLIPNWE